MSWKLNRIEAYALDNIKIQRYMHTKSRSAILFNQLSSQLEGFSLRYAFWFRKYRHINGCQCCMWWIRCKLIGSQHCHWVITKWKFVTFRCQKSFRFSMKRSALFVSYSQKLWWWESIWKLNWLNWSIYLPNGTSGLRCVTNSYLFLFAIFGALQTEFTSQLHRSHLVTYS